jgi:hypothetical protein
MKFSSNIWLQQATLKTQKNSKLLKNPQQSSLNMGEAWSGPLMVARR